MKRSVYFLCFFLLSSAIAKDLTQHPMRPGDSIIVGDQKYTCEDGAQKELLPTCYLYERGSGLFANTMERPGQKRFDLPAVIKSLVDHPKIKSSDKLWSGEPLGSLKSLVQAAIAFYFQGVRDAETQYFQSPENAARAVKELVRNGKCVLPPNHED